MRLLAGFRDRFDLANSLAPAAAATSSQPLAVRGGMTLRAPSLRLDHVEYSRAMENEKQIYAGNHSAVTKIRAPWHKRDNAEPAADTCSVASHALIVALKPILASRRCAAFRLESRLARRSQCARHPCLS
jgi:hypothetical protein